MSHQHYNIIANCWKDRKGKEMFGFMKKKKASSSKNEADFNPLDASSVLGYIKSRSQTSQMKKLLEYCVA